MTTTSEAKKFRIQYFDNDDGAWRNCDEDGAKQGMIPPDKLLSHLNLNKANVHSVKALED